MQRDYYNTELDVLKILKSHARLTELNSVYTGKPKTIIIAIDPKDDDYETVCGSALFCKGRKVR